MRIVAPILFVFAAAAKGTFRDDHSVTWFIADLQISKSPIDQGLRKHQEACFTPVTKMEKIIVIFCNLFGAI